MDIWTASASLLSTGRRWTTRWRPTQVRQLGPSTLRANPALTPDLAASYQHWQCLRFAVENGADVDASVGRAAARHGQLELLQWLRAEKACPIDETTTRSAAAGGHLALVKWLRGEGCPWNEDTARSAAEAGHFELLRYGQYMLRRAGRGGGLTEKKVLRKGCPAGTTLTLALVKALADKKKKADALKTLRSVIEEKLCGWHASTTRELAKQGDLVSGGVWAPASRGAAS